MALVRHTGGTLGAWDPFKELEEMSNRLNQLFRVGGEGGQGETREALAGFDWAPSIDISETDQAYIVRADLPGVKKEDLSITVDNGVLTVRGERKQRSEEKGEKLHRVETRYGSFMRRFTLPDNAAEEKVDAQMKNGCLEVRVPKTEEKKSKVRSVEIH
jgi:HSP20 family protein